MEVEAVEEGEVVEVEVEADVVVAEVDGMVVEEVDVVVEVDGMVVEAVMGTAVMVTGTEEGVDDIGAEAEDGIPQVDIGLAEDPFMGLIL